MNRHDRGELVARLNGRRVVTSVSGGKDSAALSLYLREMEIEHDRVFMDTGWEHNSTYDYLRGELTRVIGPVTEIRGPLQMEDLARKKGMFPSKQRRWCTDLLKMAPLKAHLSMLADERWCAQCGTPDAGVAPDDECECGGNMVPRDVVSAVGIRAAESEARSGMLEWEWSDGLDCDIWRPLIQWSEQDVIEIHTRHGLRPNPLYLLGAERVGCWPCIYARKSEIRLIADTDPERIQRIAALEREVTEVARGITAARGEELKHERTWFQAPIGGLGTWPIERVVEWSRTSFGGKQFEMFAAAGRDAGCVRWGLCDTGAKSDGGGA